MAAAVPGVAAAVEAARVARVRARSRSAPLRPRLPGVVVSLTSFPARVDKAWIAIESILGQDEPPDQVVLVLAEDEFEGRTLSRNLRRLQRRGVEIRWIPRSLRSYNKLLPVRAAFPDSIIITVDDDVIYQPWAVSRLIASSLAHPGTVIGHRGWELRVEGDRLARYSTWERASSTTPSEHVFLTGVGGVLYPPDLLPGELLSDVEAAARVCPTNDDIWFWAVSRVANVPVSCLGLSSHRSLRRLRGTAKLASVNTGQAQNDAQLARVIEHFGLRGRVGLTT